MENDEDLELALEALLYKAQNLGMVDEDESIEPARLVEIVTRKLSNMHAMLLAAGIKPAMLAAIMKEY